MSGTIRIILLSCLLLVMAPGAASAYGNCLELGIYGYQDVGGITYDVVTYFDKEDATTCTLTTPAGVFDCASLGLGWFPPSEYYDHHASMTWSELTAIVLTDWIITFDVGQPTETVASITLGPVSVSEFLPMPVVTYPVDGSSIGGSDLTVVWNYDGTDLCATPVQSVKGYLNSIEYVTHWSPELGCDAATWDTGTLIPDGAWSAAIRVSYPSRIAPGGAVGIVVGDSWVLDHEAWRNLYSIGRVFFDVTTVATQHLEMGDVKQLYR